jgi:hypothetical protein
MVAAQDAPTMRSSTAEEKNRSNAAKCACAI